MTISRSSPSSHFAIDHFIGRSAWTERTRKRVLQIANYAYSVLVTGPSGTGKEVIARAIHAHSDRHNQPFIPVNCAAIPQTLFESQLFGHVKGAFTGAQFAALGCFRAADRGTLFLDEIGDLDLDCQSKLLRVLQEKVVVPVGGQEEIPVNVRTVAATNRNLLEEVKAGRFRLDLYYRLNVLSMETLGLSQRPEDIGPLAQHFLAKTSIECGLPLKVLSPAALELLMTYAWPGNVRELENFMERAVVHEEGDLLGPESFPDVIDALTGTEAPSILPGGYFAASLPSGLSERDRPMAAATSPGGQGPAPESDEFSLWPSLEAVEREHLLATLRKTYFNQSAAARLLNIDRKLLARKMKKYAILAPKRA